MDHFVSSAPPRARAASHVLLVEPVNFRYNRETGDTNAFQTAPPPAEEQALSELAVEQHHRLRDLLVKGDVATLSVEIESHIMRLRRQRKLNTDV